MGKPEILVEPQQYFGELVDEAFEKRKLNTSPLMKSYLANILLHFMRAENLYDETTESGRKTHSTLAELYLKAMNSSYREERLHLLKRLGETSLYIGGVFGESLQRKLVDIGYYADMGGAAYLSLSDWVEEEIYSKLYREIASQFISIMDVLTLVAQKTLIQNNENILKLYETYIQTGSDLAKDHLLEKGILNLPDAGKKRYSQ